MIVLAAPLVPGLEVNGFLPGLALASVLTVAITIVNVVLAVDEDESFYDELARRIAATALSTRSWRRLQPSRSWWAATAAWAARRTARSCSIRPI